MQNKLNFHTNINVKNVQMVTIYNFSHSLTYNIEFVKFYDHVSFTICVQYSQSCQYIEAEFEPYVE